MIDFDSLLPEKEKIVDGMSEIIIHGIKSQNTMRDAIRARLEKRLKVVGWLIAGSIYFTDEESRMKKWKSKGYNCVPLIVIDGGDDEKD